jgi:hypothetical protein
MDGDVSISIAVTSIWACGVPDAMDGAWCTAPFQLRLHATDYQRRHLAYARIWIWNTELEKIHSSIGRAQSFQIDNAHRCWVSIRLIDPP